MKSVGSRVKRGPDGLGGYPNGPADLIGRDLFGLRQALRPMVRARLRIADGLGQHLAQFRLRLRGFPRESSFLPANHQNYVGMQEGEVNAPGDRKYGQQPFEYGPPADNPRQLWSDADAVEWEDPERFSGSSVELSSDRCRYRCLRPVRGSRFLRRALRRNPGARCNAREERIRRNHRVHG